MLDLRLSPEYYRLNATVALQKEAGDEARRFLSEAEKLLRDETPTDRAGILLWKRQVNVLGRPNWDGTDGAEEVLAAVEKRFPPGTIEFSNALNWDVAAALCTDSSDALKRAEELLDKDFRYVIGFGHQASIATLLRIASVLPVRIRPEFVRTALYANAFRDD